MYVFLDLKKYEGAFLKRGELEILRFVYFSQES